MEMKHIPYLGNINRLLIIICTANQVRLIRLFLKQSYNAVFSVVENKILFFVSLMVFIPIAVFIIFNVMYLEHKIVITKEGIERTYFNKKIDLIKWNDVKTFKETERFLIISKYELQLCEKESILYCRQKGTLVIRKFKDGYCKSHQRKLQFLIDYFHQQNIIKDI